MEFVGGHNENEYIDQRARSFMYTADSGGDAFENSQEILANLRIVSGICSLFSFIVLCILLYNLNYAIQRAYSLAEKRRLPMYRYTAIFVFIFLVNILLLVTVPWLNGTFPYADFLMDLLLFLALITYFAWWHAGMELFIKKRYALMLKNKDLKNRLTYMARLMNLGSKSLSEAFDSFSMRRRHHECL